jgi:hypothetical protein
MANSAYWFGAASDSVATANAGIQGPRLKGWRVGQIAGRDPPTHLQNGSRQHHSADRSEGIMGMTPGHNNT